MTLADIEYEEVYNLFEEEGPPFYYAGTEWVSKNDYYSWRVSLKEFICGTELKVVAGIIQHGSQHNIEQRLVYGYEKQRQG